MLNHGSGWICRGDWSLRYSLVNLVTFRVLVASSLDTLPGLLPLQISIICCLTWLIDGREMLPVLLLFFVLESSGVKARDIKRSVLTRIFPVSAHQRSSVRRVACKVHERTLTHLRFHNDFHDFTTFFL